MANLGQQPPDTPAEDRIDQATFRQTTFAGGLKGEALIWYRCQLNDATRQNWLELARLFRERFPTDSEPAVLESDIAAQVTRFKRKLEKPLSEYIARARRLGRLVVNDAVKLILADNIIQNLCDGESGEQIRRDLETRLMSLGVMTAKKSLKQDELRNQEGIQLILDTLEGLVGPMDFETKLDRMGKMADPGTGIESMTKAFERLALRIEGRASSQERRTSSETYVRPQDLGSSQPREDIGTIFCGSGGHLVSSLVPGTGLGLEGDDG